MGTASTGDEIMKISVDTVDEVMLGTKVLNNIVGTNLEGVVVDSLMLTPIFGTLDGNLLGNLLGVASDADGAVLDNIDGVLLVLEVNIGILLGDKNGFKLGAGVVVSIGFAEDGLLDGLVLDRGFNGT